MGYFFGLVVLISVLVWWMRRRKERSGGFLCPHCRRWHEESCRSAERPEAESCRYYVRVEEDLREEFCQEALDKEES
jgi:hypothetical protein